MKNAFAVTPSAATEKNDLIGRSFAGYQAWFSTAPHWFHWSARRNEAPSAHNAHTEMFPACRAYPDEALCDTAFAPFLDGTPVRLYEAKHPAAIDTHFRLMARYGIDGVGVQRFFGATSPEEQPEPTHLTAIMQAAERHGRLFYVMYDTSGYGRGGNGALQRMQADLLHNVEGKGLITSPAYAHAHGKPVICVWGLSPLEPGRYPPADEAVELIRWLKERGYFVIGGLPDNSWAEDTGDYAAVYAALDMISPWTPGRFRQETLGAWIDDHLARDLAYVKAHGQEYQPVLHAGFAWSNFQNGGEPNATPRAAGSFLWEQAKRYAAAGVRGVYFAMLDEYDEGTALLPAASDSFDLPSDTPYFQTLSCDGRWLSSDFYMRLGGAITAALRGERAVTEEVPVPHSEGPVFWRNGFEKRHAFVMLHGARDGADWRPVDVCVADGKVLRQDAVQLETAQITQGEAATGQFAFAFGGFGMSAGRCHVTYRIAETCIPVTAGLTLSYQFSPRSAAGDCVGVELLFDDGTRLSDYLPAVLQPKGAYKEDGEDFVPQNIPLPNRLVGRTVTAVAATYDAAGEVYFKAYLDDIILQK